MSQQRPSITLILLDGTCVFCNRLVRFILRHDRGGVFRFAHLQSEAARTVLARHSLELDIDAIYAVTDYETPQERVLLDGEAGRAVWPRLFWFAGLLRFVPLTLLNLQYRLLAKVRYRLFGQSSACILPDPTERSRFLC